MYSFVTYGSCIVSLGHPIYPWTWTDPELKMGLNIGPIPGFSNSSSVGIWGSIFGCMQASIPHSLLGVFIGLAGLKLVQGRPIVYCPNIYDHIQPTDLKVKSSPCLHFIMFFFMLNMLGPP